MGRAELQGTPWHEEQIHKTCKEGSKYCIYNVNKLCSCKYCSNYNLYCIGKGNCDWFEPKTGMPKVTDKKTIIIKQNPQNSKLKDSNINKESRLLTKHYTPRNQEIKQEEISHMSTQQITDTKDKVKETSEEKFLRLSKERVNNVIDDIRKLSKLSNTNTYSYTDEQVDKMFSCIENILQDTKESFKKKQPIQEFKWD